MSLIKWQNRLPDEVLNLSATSIFGLTGEYQICFLNSAGKAKSQKMSNA